MNNMANDAKTHEFLLNEILATPAKETLANRYSAEFQTSDAGCHAGCTGACGVAG
jgi:hypothetical protein